MNVTKDGTQLVAGVRLNQKPTSSFSTLEICSRNYKTFFITSPLQSAFCWKLLTRILGSFVFAIFRCNTKVTTLEGNTTSGVRIYPHRAKAISLSLLLRWVHQLLRKRCRFHFHLVCLPLIWIYVFLFFAFALSRCGYTLRYIFVGSSKFTEFQLHRTKVQLTVLCHC